MVEGDDQAVLNSIPLEFKLKLVRVVGNVYVLTPRPRHLLFISFLSLVRLGHGSVYSSVSLFDSSFVLNSITPELVISQTIFDPDEHICHRCPRVLLLPH